MPPLHLHRFGPTAADPHVLAVHGLTGHGLRWAPTARALSPVGVLAPDLRGHGRSPWTPPWSIEAHVADLRAVLDLFPDTRPVLVGHSFGGNLVTHLAHALGDRVRALVLVDPALGLDPEFALQVATAYADSPHYPDRAEARADKLHGGWADVPAARLDADVDEHLIDLPGGRYGWRVAVPAAVAAWGEMARPAPLPPAGLPTTVLRAGRVRPPFTTDAHLDRMAALLGPELTVRTVDAEHMLTQSHPELIAAEIAALLARSGR